MHPSQIRHDAEQFMMRCERDATNHAVIGHPFLKALSNSTFPGTEEVLKDFLFQYFAYSENFIRYLCATVAQLTHVSHRQVLLMNIAEEVGSLSTKDREILLDNGIDPEAVDGFSHPDLFIRALNALGLTASWRESHPYDDHAIAWSRSFLQLCSYGGESQAIGAIGMGTENVVKLIYTPILASLRTVTTLTPYERVFFDLHTQIDDSHGSLLKEIAMDLACIPENRPAIYQGMQQALTLRQIFFDHMHQKAEKIAPLYLKAS